MNESNKQLIIGFLPYAILILVILFIVYTVLKRIGLIKSNEEKRKDKTKEQNVETLLTAPYFNPKFYNEISFNRLVENEIKDFAKQIHSSFGINDNEARIYSAFNKLNNKTQISQIAEYYYSKYGSDLRADLMNNLNKTEQSKLISIINNLPDKK